MTNKLNIVWASLAVLFASSGCVSRGNDPGWEYAPDMYYSKGYEPYNQADSFTLNPYGMSMREPVAGSIALGKSAHIYPLANTGEGYEASATQIIAPAGLDLIDTRGKYLYDIYCTACHGAEGNNDGKVFQKVAALKPAWKGYSDEYIKTLEDGKIYHTLTYGKNNMGSHASVLEPTDRWRVVKYVKLLSGAGSVSVSTSNTATVASNTMSN
jgi:mono/diheme cytochrome c family protein